MRFSAFAGTEWGLLAGFIALGVLSLAVCAAVPGAKSTCIGIYFRYPEVPTTHEAAFDDMRSLGVEHLVFWLSTKDLYPANAVETPEFARFVTLMRQRDLKIMAGVGTMLMWWGWAKEYPEWVMQDPSGKPNKYGYPCWSNPDMARAARKIAATIVRKAVQTADDVISSWFIYDEVLWGWVTDNCHCPACQAGYRRWLRRKGHDPAALGFKSWAEVRLAVSPTQANNALHEVTSNEYREDTLMDFLAAEIAVVKRTDPKRRAVTTSGIYPVVAQSDCAIHGNHARKFQRVFDFTMSDPYPISEAGDNYTLQMVSPIMATMHDPTRRVPTMLVVQDFTGPPHNNVIPTPSQTRKLCFQAIGNGATGLVPFIYDCGLKKGPDGKFTQEPFPRRIEFASIANWMRDPLVSDLLCQAHPLPSVGVVFPQNWYRRYCLDHPLSRELERGFTIFRDLFQDHYQVTVLFPEDLAKPSVLSRYSAIIATGAWDVGPEYGVGRAHERALRSFVENGGALLVSGRTRLLPMAREVVSEDASVIWNNESLNLPALSRAIIETQPGDRLLARYKDGSPAAVVRKMGQGRIGIMPSIMHKDWVGEGERYVEALRRYVFDPALSASARRAAAVRRAVADMMAALHVPRPVEARDEKGQIAWHVQPMTLEGKGYWLTFLINYHHDPHNLALRMRPPAGAGSDWAVVDFFTGEALPVTRRDLARGIPIRIGAGRVRAFAVAWEQAPARRLSTWRPTHPYTPAPD